MCKRGRVSCCVSQYGISSVSLRDEPEMHTYHTNQHSNGYQKQQSIVEAKQSQSTPISNETSVSGYLTNYTHDRYCASEQPEQHTSNLHSPNHTSHINISVHHDVALLP